MMRDFRELNRGYIHIHRTRATLVFTAQRANPKILNRISSYLRQNEGIARLARLVFLQPRRAQVTWSALALSRRYWSKQSKITIDYLRREARQILPEYKPRKQRHSSPFFSALRRWLHRHSYFREKSEYELLGPDGGLINDAMNTDLPRGFRFVGAPTFTWRHGAVLRLRCDRLLSLQQFFERLTDFVRRFGHGDALTAALPERGFVRLQYISSSRHGSPCIHAGEIQVEGRGARKAIRDFRRALASAKPISGR